MSTFSTSDLRSHAKEFQRDRNHTHKWARGAASAPGKHCDHVEPLADVCHDCAVRPLNRDYDRRCGRHYTALKQNWNNKTAQQKTTASRKVLRNEVVDATDGPMNTVSDSSSEDDLKEVYAAHEPHSEVFYSYDAHRSPVSGTNILAHAVTQAVLRYENKVTEKLVKEYDFVDDESKDFTDGYTADADEDDFELIELSHLN